MLYVCKIEENGVVHVKDTDDGSVEQMQYYELVRTVETLGIKVAGVNFGRVSIPSQVEMRVAAYGDAAKRMVQNEGDVWCGHVPLESNLDYLKPYQAQLNRMLKLAETSYKTDSAVWNAGEVILESLSNTASRDYRVCKYVLNFDRSVQRFEGDVCIGFHMHGRRLTIAMGQTGSNGAFRLACCTDGVHREQLYETADKRGKDFTQSAHYEQLLAKHISRFNDAFMKWLGQRNGYVID